MTTPFAQPKVGGDEFEPKDHNGQLLLFVPQHYEPSASTKFGSSPAADTDIIALDVTDPATGQPKIYRNSRVFGNLANSVRGAVGGGVILARLGQGPNTKGNPPWILLDHTEQDAARAMPVYDAYKRGEFTQPQQQPAAPPQPDPWAGVNASPQPPQGWGAPPPPAPPQQQWGAPPAQAPAPPQQQAWGGPPPPQAAAPAVDPGLVAFLAERGVTVTPDMTQATAEAIARTYQS